VQPAPQLAPEAEALMRAWHWPGNLRELHNVIEFARAVCRDGVIRLHDLPDHLLAAVGEADAVAVGAPAVLPAEAQLLLQYLRAARWNVSAVAHQMGLSRMTVYRRMKRWGIEAPVRGD
jgi:transcriptional regulator of acetoin/glycerol metabolism